LYEENLKQKLTANQLTQENMRLRTRLQILEQESVKKDKVIGGMGAGKQGQHLALNLKRRLKEM